VSTAASAAGALGKDEEAEGGALQTLEWAGGADGGCWYGGAGRERRGLRGKWEDGRAGVVAYVLSPDVDLNPPHHFL